MMSDLSMLARMHLLGYCRGDARRAESVGRVVLLRLPTRRVARESGMSESTLRGTARGYRSQVAAMIQSGAVKPSQLVEVREEAPVRDDCTRALARMVAKKPTGAEPLMRRV